MKESPSAVCIVNSGYGLLLLQYTLPSFLPDLSQSVLSHACLQSNDHPSLCVHLCALSNKVPSLINVS